MEGIFESENLRALFWKPGMSLGVEIFLFSTKFPLFTYWGPASQEPWDNNIPWPSGQIRVIITYKVSLHVRLNSVLYSVHVIFLEWNQIQKWNFEAEITTWLRWMVRWAASLLISLFISRYLLIFSFFLICSSSCTKLVRFTYQKDDLFDLLASDKHEELRGGTKSRLL